MIRKVIVLGWCHLFINFFNGLSSVFLYKKDWKKIFVNENSFTEILINRKNLFFYWLVNLRVWLWISKLLQSFVSSNKIMKQPIYIFFHKSIVPMNSYKVNVFFMRRLSCKSIARKLLCKMQESHNTTVSGKFMHRHRQKFRKILQGNRQSWSRVNK